MPIVWKEPPPKSSGHPRHPWNEIAEELKTRPGEWALVVSNTPTAIASPINRGQYLAFAPAGSFEARSVTKAKDAEGKQSFDIYVRYIGEPEADK